MTTRRHLLLIIAATLLAACSKDDADSRQTTQEQQQEIRLMTDVRQVMEGRRAATFDNATALQTEGSFSCTAYEASTLTTYISTTTVNWNAGTSAWAFSGGSHYYWPLPATNGGIYPSLDFFAYMPATAPSYITTGPTYTDAHNVTFTCSNLPMTNAEQEEEDFKEFMFGMALGQSYTNAAAGVPLTFQHPFARIKLQLAASHPDVTIRSITLKGIKNNGDYDLSADPQWTTSGDATDFVLTLTGDARIFIDNPASTQQIGEYYLMIPQDWAGVIEVDADCLFWGDKKNYPALTTTIPTTWQPGKSYTYTLNISPDDLKVNIEKFTEQW